MIYDAKTMEERAILQAAERACAAARTAPKTRGIDQLTTLTVTGADKDRIADQMELLSSQHAGYDFFVRDAANVRAAQAVVLVAAREDYRGTGALCAYCHYADCAQSAASGGLCAYVALDLGIALGSAVSQLADARLDNRIMFSVGRAARDLQLLDEEFVMIMGIPLSVSGKAPFFDRKFPK